MIALDTNVILRYLVQDDAEQSAAATRLFERRLSTAEPGFVSLIVVCEVVWTLTSAYRQTRAAIAEALTLLIAAKEIEVEFSDIVSQALGDRPTGIVDAIIHRRGLARGCETTLTFDRKFAQLKGVKLLR